MIDPSFPGDFRRLQDCLHTSRTDLGNFLEKRRKNWKEYVGAHYSNRGADKEVYLNLIELGVSVLSQNLTQNPPRVSVRANDDTFRAAAIQFESVVNRRIQDPMILRSLQRAVKAAFFLMGLVKVGLKSAPAVSMQGQQIPRQVPFVSHITADNWVADMSAECVEEQDFRGQRYAQRLDELQRRPGVDPEMAAQCNARDSKQYDDEMGRERLGSIMGLDTETKDYTPRCEVWDIFLPNEQLLITVDSQFRLPRPIAIVPWVGPERGPYHQLGFDEVEGTTIPKAPITDWYGQHLLSNVIFNKLAEQGKASKIVGYAFSDDPLAQKLMKAANGDVISGDKPADQALQNVEIGGLDQKNFAFLLQLKNLWNWGAGNMDVMGGLAAGSDTLGQDRIMQSSSSMRIAKLQQNLVEFEKGVLTDYAWYLWTDPIESYPSEVFVEGFGQVKTTLSPFQRQHAFSEHMLEVDPYAMRYRSPAEILQQITGVMTQVILPMMPMLQQQGITINATELLDLFSRYGNWPELRRILNTGGMPMPGPEGRGEGPGSTPKLTTTKDGRENPGGYERTLINSLLGGQVGEGQVNSMMQRMAG